MAKFAGDVHFATESGERLFFLDRLLGGQDLEGDSLAELALDGEEDFSHAPFAKLTEHAITAKEEAAGGAGEDFAGLIGGEITLFDEDAGKLARVVAEPLSGKAGADAIDLGAGAARFWRRWRRIRRVSSTSFRFRTSPASGLDAVFGEDAEGCLRVSKRGVRRRRTALESNFGPSRSRPRRRAVSEGRGSPKRRGSRRR